MNYKGIARFGVVLLGGIGTCEAMKEPSVEPLFVELENSEIIKIIDDTGEKVGDSLPKPIFHQYPNSDSNPRAVSPEKLKPTQQDLEDQFTKDADEIYQLLDDQDFRFFMSKRISSTGVVYTQFMQNNIKGNSGYAFALPNIENIDNNYRYNVVFIFSSQDGENSKEETQYLRANTLEDLTDQIIERVEPTFYIVSSDD